MSFCVSPKPASLRTCSGSMFFLGLAIAQPFLDLGPSLREGPGSASVPSGSPDPVAGTGARALGNQPSQLSPKSTSYQPPRDVLGAVWSQGRGSLSGGKRRKTRLFRFLVRASRDLWAFLLGEGRFPRHSHLSPEDPKTSCISEADVSRTGEENAARRGHELRRACLWGLEPETAEAVKTVEKTA